MSVFHTELGIWPPGLDSGPGIRGSVAPFPLALGAPAWLSPAASLECSEDSLGG